MKYHINTYSLELKKVWDESDSSLYASKDKKLTANDYLTYWEAVDRSIKYANTLLMKKEEQKQQKKHEDTARPHMKQKTQHSLKFSNARYDNIIAQEDTDHR